MYPSRPRPSKLTQAVVFCSAALAGTALAMVPAGASAIESRPAHSSHSGVAAPSGAQGQVTTPVEEFGFNLGDDYRLANYQQLLAYWEKLARESDRMIVRQIGSTEGGRPMVMAIITSPENHRNLDRYQEISRRMALAEGLSDEDARQLAKEGKAVVWIDGGLHATEVLGAQQLMETIYQMASREDEETLRFLNDVILLAVCVNPDGLDWVADWYMRNPEPTERSTSWLPHLYQKYVGHDNNRDFYMSTQSETIAINRVLYREWFPQIVYNHHQTGPPGVVLFAPPFRDPFNYFIDPLVILGIDTVGTAMHSRFVREGKPGSTMRSGASYSTWWNGGLRTTPYYHNQIGLLTETIGSPNPIEIPFILSRQLPDNDLPAPIAPQEWHFRQSIDYSVTANRAVLDIASKLREDFLFNIYRMGKNAIERGNRDHWTLSPARIAAVEAAMAAEPEEEGDEEEGDEEEQSATASLSGRGGVSLEYYEKNFRDPEARDPRGFIIPSNQDDFPTAVKFIDTLIKNGVNVLRATSEFEVDGKSYPTGSYVVKAAQAFRAFVLDMFEPQVHPNDFAYPGAAPTPPYDVAGWTVAYQMGVEFDRVLDGFDGPFEGFEGFAVPPEGTVGETSGATGYLLNPRANDGFAAINRLLSTGEDVYRLAEPISVDGSSFPAGTIYVRAAASTLNKLQGLAGQFGLHFKGTAEPPRSDSVQLRPARIGLWDRYGGSMPSGWTRWIFEKFEFPFEVVYPPELDAGNLASRFDVLVFTSGAIPAPPGVAESDRFSRFSQGGPDPEEIPTEYRDRIGNVTADTTIPQLRRFVEAGGTLVAVGNSAGNLASHLGLPVQNALVERSPEGTVRPLPVEKFYVPGSVLELQVDTTHPVAWGMTEKADVFFRRSPAWRLPPNSSALGIEAVAWFGEEPLRSGWAWGQTYLEDSAAVVSVQLGNGRVVLLGPEVNFRAQPHGTFKLLFNNLYKAEGRSILSG